MTPLGFLAWAVAGALAAVVISVAVYLVVGFVGDTIYEWRNR